MLGCIRKRLANWPRLARSPVAILSVTQTVRFVVHSVHYEDGNQHRCKTSGPIPPREP